MLPSCGVKQNPLLPLILLPASLETHDLRRVAVLSVDIVEETLQRHLFTSGSVLGSLLQILERPKLVFLTSMEKKPKEKNFIRCFI